MVTVLVFSFHSQVVSSLQSGSFNMVMQGLEVERTTAVGSLVKHDFPVFQTHVKQYYWQP